MEPTLPARCRRWKLIEQSTTKQAIDGELDPEQTPEKNVPPVVGNEIDRSATWTVANPEALLQIRTPPRY